jgi:hypothetical protein
MEENLKALTEPLQRVAELSAKGLQSYMDMAADNIATLGKSMPKMNLRELPMDMFNLGNMLNAPKKNDTCCPPKQECPPHCIAQITRHAYPRERIIVPITVKNTCTTAKTYRVGVRDLVSLNGATAPAQPSIQPQQITLQPGSSQTVLMAIDLAQFQAGQTYETEVVLRENDYNQNVCFRLVVDGYGDAPVAEPVDEQKYRLRWQSWQSHFYCTPKREK